MEDIIYIACDDSGAELKGYIIDYLKNHQYKYVDCGSGDEPSRYPYYAAKVASKVSKGEIKRGILICGTGIGISIAANKFKGVRAALCTDSYQAGLTRRHNDSNILCLGGRIVGRWTALAIVDTWLNEVYDAGHHQGSVDLINEMESFMFNDNIWCPDEIPYPEFDWDHNQRL